MTKHISADNCYFCNHPLIPINNVYSEYCKSCAAQHDVECYTSINEDRELLFAHIYVDKSQKIEYPHPTIGPIIITIGFKYHFRLHLKEGYTVLSSMDYETYENDEITALSGFPVIPGNAKDKLQTILTFL